MDTVHPGGLGGTYGGNPVALAALETVREEGLITRARQIGDLAVARLRELQRADQRIGDVRGRGAMIGVEFVRPGTHEPDAELARAVVAAAHRAGRRIPVIAVIPGRWHAAGRGIDTYRVRGSCPNWRLS